MTTKDIRNEMQYLSRKIRNQKIQMLLPQCAAKEQGQYLSIEDVNHMWHPYGTNM